MPTLPRFDYQQYMRDESVLAAALDTLHHAGLVLITDAPVDVVPASASDPVVAGIASRIAVIQETFYGRTFDVRSVKQAENIAYTAVELGPHSDLCYFEAPPGVQLLHSLIADATGGENYFVDAYALAESIAETAPDEHRALCTVPVSFQYSVGGQRMRHVRPILAPAEANDHMGVFWSPPFEGPLSAATEPAELDAFYAGYRRFHAGTVDPANYVSHRLAPGECVMFLNRRVLHARRAFDPRTGGRLLRGAYVGLSDFKSRWRALNRPQSAQYAPKPASQPT